MSVTFSLVVVGWVIFRAENIVEAFDYICRMFADFHFTVPMIGRKAVLYVILLLVIEWLQRNASHGLQISHKGVFAYRVVRWGVYYVLCLLTLFLAGLETDFIYFQF